MLQIKNCLLFSGELDSVVLPVKNGQSLGIFDEVSIYRQLSPRKFPLDSSTV
jgi:hypothetical protein